MSIWDQFGRPEPVDVADTPFADPQGYWSRLWTGQQTGPQVRDPQTMRTDPWVWSGGGTAARTSDLAWDEALMSPGQRKAAEVMGSEPVSKLMMLANFLGPSPKMPRAVLSAEKGIGARPEPSALVPKAKAMGASSVLAETGGSLSGLDPRSQAQLVARALGATTGRPFDVLPGGSAAGQSAYVRTPLGDLRFSDHAAGARPGQARDFYAQPAATVDDVISYYTNALQEQSARIAARDAADIAARTAKQEANRPIVEQQAANRAAKEEFWRQNGLETATQTAKDKAWKQYKAGGGEMGEPPKGIRAYHGSPHDFDRFDLSKIGTGEGAQAYGRGLYFAESEAVARDYRNRLAPPSEATIGGKPLTRDVIDDIAMGVVEGRNWRGVARTLHDRLKSSDDVSNYAARLNEIDMALLQKTFPAVAADVIAEKRIFDELVKQGLDVKRPNPGRMYEVNIKADPQDFLDWDVPLSQQSEKVRKQFEALHPPSERLGAKAKELFGTDNPFHKWKDDEVAKIIEGARGDMTGQEAHSLLGSELVKGQVDKLPGFGVGSASQEQAAQRLREAGIPGIRYKDAGSRGAEGGTSNYVVFSDDLIEILRKYGLAGILAGGASLATPSQGDAAQ